MDSSHEQEARRIVGEALASGRAGMPASIGPYEITGVLGEGGMGVVYRGRQTEPIERDVAVKILQAGMSTERVLERFAWERRTLARMNHPNIASILDAGSDEGRPYVVLELVEGAPVTTWCRNEDSGRLDRLRLMERACQAVQHAHDRGVLHRDLKPGNILVREVDGKPTPSIIDFGIAKALDDTTLEGERIELTREGQMIGTPAYMSPEQLDGRTKDVDVRTDVYALGVILYELLSDRRPFSDEHITNSKSREDPQPPSRASEKPDLKGDLDSICLMAVHPDPERRYRSAAELGEDLRRFRERRPVLASPDSLRYRAGKLVRRHPVAAALVAALLAFVAVGVIFLGYHANRLDVERLRALEAEAAAHREAEAASEISGFLEGLFSGMDPIYQDETPTTAVDLLDKGALQLEEDLGDQPENRGRLWSVLGRVNQSLARHDLAEDQLRSSLAAFAEAADTNATLAARAETWALLATCLHDLGKYPESENAYRMAIGLNERLSPEVTIPLVQVTTDLATAIQAQGRTDEALAVLWEAVDMARTLGAEGEAEVAYISNLRGYLQFQRGYFKAALADLEAALESQRRLLEPGSYALVNSLNNVGGMYLHLERFAEARTHLEEAHAILEKVFQGESHPAVSRSYLQLGWLALAEGDSTTAVINLTEAHDRTLEQLGPDHPSTWSARQGLAAVLQIEGRLAEAEAIHEDVLRRFTERSGRHHHRALRANYKLGLFLLETGRPVEARSHLESVIATYQEMGLPDHPYRNLARIGVAEAHLDEGAPARAVTQFDAALPGLIETFGEPSPPVQRARALQARSP